VNPLSVSRFLLALALLGMLFGPIRAAAADKETRVVYHVGDAAEQATRTLLFVNNHLSADPNVKIVVVAQSAGIDFLLKKAVDKNGVEYEPAIKELVKSGRVEFRICNVSLMSRHVPADGRIPEATVVDSGVREIARLQAQEGYAYIRP